MTKQRKEFEVGSEINYYEVRLNYYEVRVKKSRQKFTKEKRSYIIALCMKEFKVIKKNPTNYPPYITV